MQEKQDAEDPGPVSVPCCLKLRKKFNQLIENIMCIRSHPHPLSLEWGAHPPRSSLHDSTSLSQLPVTSWGSRLTTSSLSFCPLVIGKNALYSIIG